MNDIGSGGFQPSRHERPVLVANWRDAEELAAWHMANTCGLAGAALTNAGADSGVDVVAADAVAQVKHYTQLVGRPEVQQLRGAAHGTRHAIFYALSGYTAGAREYAEGAGVALYEYTVYGDVKAVGGVAESLLRSASERSQAHAQAQAESDAAQGAADAHQLASTRAAFLGRPPTPLQLEIRQLWATQGEGNQALDDTHTMKVMTQIEHLQSEAVLALYSALGVAHVCGDTSTERGADSDLPKSFMIACALLLQVNLVAAIADEATAETLGLLDECAAALGYAREIVELQRDDLELALSLGAIVSAEMLRTSILAPSLSFLRGDPRGPLGSPLEIAIGVTASQGS